MTEDTVIVNDAFPPFKPASESPNPAMGDAHFVGFCQPALPDAPHASTTLTTSESSEPPSEDTLTPIKLGDHYDECLLGATIRGNMAYSIKRLVQLEMRNRKCSEEEARRYLGEDMVELHRVYGYSSPEFIDDELMEARVEIIMPG